MRPEIGASRSESSFASVDLPFAVLPEQRDPVVLVDAEVEVAEHRPPVVADADVLEPDDRRRQLLRRRKVEAGDVVLDHRGDRLHPLERLDPALRLPRLRRLGAEAVDEGLHVRARRVLLLLRRHLLLEPCPAGVVEGVVAALVERQLLPVQVQDRVDRPVQQVLVVADDEHGVRVACEEALEPDRALEVEVVGRLVEQQHVGPREQHRRQRHPHPPAAGEVGAGALLRRGVEAEAAEDRGRPRLGRMRLDVGEPRLDLGDPVGVRRLLRLGEQRRPLDVGRQHRVDEAVPGRRRFLRDAADPRPLRNLDLAGVERQLAADQPEQRGLARCRCARRSRPCGRRGSAPRRRRTGACPRS